MAKTKRNAPKTTSASDSGNRKNRNFPKHTLEEDARASSENSG